jgi:Co/Zn/Cd efflux system component
MHHIGMTSCSAPKETQAASSGGCGCGETVTFDGASSGYKRALIAVIAINILGCVVVAVGSWWAGSAALAANTMDFAADAATYALSLWAIGRSVRVRTGAALIKGASLGVMAVAILGFAAWRVMAGVLPDGGAITGLGLFGVAANLLAAIVIGFWLSGRKTAA